MKRFLLAIMAVACLCLTGAASTKYRDFTVRDGLAGSSVKTIFQDSRGLMWFGSWNGVSRFDGMSFTNLTSSPFDSSTPTNDVIGTFAEHPDGSIWFSTNLGVNRLDPYTLKCERYYLGYTSSLSGIHSVSIDISDSGDVFCSSGGWGMAYWDSSKDEMVPFNIAGINASEVGSIFCLNDGLLLIRSDEGVLHLVRYETSGAAVTTVQAERLFQDSIAGGCWKLSDGTVAVHSPGLIRIVGKDGRLVGKETRIPEGAVTSVCITPTKNLLIVLDEQRLLNVNPYEGTSSRVPQDMLDNILSVCFASQDTFWAGIDGMGVRMYYESAIDFREVGTEGLFGGAGNIISCCGGWYDDIILSSMGNGLAFIRKDQTVTQTAGSGSGLHSDRVFSMAKGFREGEIFVGDEQELALLTYDRAGHHRVTHLMDLGVRVYYIFPDREESCLWIGTYLGGLKKVVLKPSGSGYAVEEVQSWSDNTAGDARLLSGNVMSVIKDDDGLIWMGTLGGGISILDPKENKVRNINTQSEDLPLCNNDVLYLMKGEDSSIWAGTGHGLNHFTKNVDGYDTEVWTSTQGLNDNSVHGILEDSNGSIWVSTSRGISCLSRKSGSITNYNDRRLLSTYEFCNHACTELPDGLFFFGGVGGGCFFMPEEIRQRNYVPKIIFNGVYVKEQRVDSGGEGRVIRLKHSENQLTIRFTAIDYINSENCEYKYRLSGFESDWTNAGTDGRAFYTNIPAGRYTFEVRSTNGDKAEVDNTGSLEIQILNPWWKQAWAICLWLAIMLSVLGAILKVEYDKKENRRALAREAMERDHQRDTYEAKLRFFTNVAHEFGTPLTLISSSTEQLQESGISGEKSIRNLKTIKSSASRMQKLIDEIMDFRKVEVGKYKPKYSRFDIRSILSDIMEDFSEINEKNAINLTLELPEDRLEMVSDLSAVEKILTNLISNAYKYTPVRGDIRVSLKPEDGGIRFEVRNSGKGIRPEDLPKVFDRFTILDTFEKQAKDNSIRRNGVGMALVDSLTDMLSGKVSVASELGKHTTFSLYLPSEDESKIETTAAVVQISSPVIQAEMEDVAAAPAVPDHEKRLVMAVDDERKVLDVMKDILSASYRVVTAENGAVAAEMLKAETPDIIISDISMPEMDGIEFLKHVKGNQLTRTIPFLFVAFRADIEDEVKAYELGCDGIVHKPFNPKQLNAIISGILASRENLRSYYTSMLSNLETYDGKVVNSEEKDFLSRMVSVIEGNLTNPDISIDFIADAMCISKGKMNSSLKELTGKSPSEFIMSVKINHATQLLKTTSMNVQEVMYASGFNNKSYFFREFKKVHDVTPKQFRDSHQQTLL